MSTSDEYTLWYWPIKGRGEFIRLMFEEAGVKYKAGHLGEVDEAGKPLYDDVKSRIRKGTIQGQTFPAFAFPILIHGNMTLSQTPVICRYLGKQFGMWPDTEADEWHAEQINNTVHDFIAEGRLVFHAKGFVESYYSQKEETQPYIDWFVKDRLHLWLGFLEKCLAANNGGSGFVVGNKLTYADLALFHVLNAAESQFPDGWAKVKANIPLLVAFQARIAGRPNMAAYLASSRNRAFEGNSMM